MYTIDDLNDGQYDEHVWDYYAEEGREGYWELGLDIFGVYRLLEKSE